MEVHDRPFRHLVMTEDEWARVKAGVHTEVGFVPAVEGRPWETVAASAQRFSGMDVYVGERGCPCQKVYVDISKVDELTRRRVVVLGAVLVTVLVVLLVIVVAQGLAQ